MHQVKCLPSPQDSFKSGEILPKDNFKPTFLLVKVVMEHKNSAKLNIMAFVLLCKKNKTKLKGLFEKMFYLHSFWQALPLNISKYK